MFSQKVTRDLARENGWKVVQPAKWYLLGDAKGFSPAQTDKKLVPIAMSFKVTLEVFVGKVERELRKGRKVKAIQCQDGILVHPQVLALVVGELLKGKLGKSVCD